MVYEELFLKNNCGPLKSFSFFCEIYFVRFKNEVKMSIFMLYSYIRDIVFIFACLTDFLRLNFKNQG